jgi:hypothetical protein
MNLIEKHPMLSLLFVMILTLSTLHALNDTATIEIIDGKEYITAINGVDIDPRRPNRYDIELIWEYK